MTQSPVARAPENAPELSNALRQRHITMIALGGVIGAGLFVGSSTAILKAGPAVVFSYLLAGLMAFLVMRMLGEMAVARPGKGSFIEYIRLALGNGAAFVTGWLYWFFWVVVIAAETIAAFNILASWVLAPAWLVDGLLIAALALSNLLSVKAYGDFEFWFASIKVAAIVVFIALGVGALAGVGGHGGFHHLTADGGFFPAGAAAILGAVPVVVFSIFGTEVATIAAAESDNPAEHITRAARSVVLRIVAFYVGSVFLIVCLVTWSSLKSGESPFVAALNAMGLPGAAPVMTGVVLTAVLSCLNSGIYVTSRILFELSRNGEAPGLFAQLNGRRVPVGAILASVIPAYLITISGIVSPDRIFAFLLNASGSLLLAIYGVIAWAQIALRRRLEREDPESLRLRVWLFPWLTYGVIAAILAILVEMTIDPAARPQILASGLSVAVALAGYALFQRPRRSEKPATVR